MSARTVTMRLTKPQYDALNSAAAFYQAYIEQDGDGSAANRGELRALDNAWSLLHRAWAAAARGSKR